MRVLQLSRQSFASVLSSRLYLVSLICCLLLGTLAFSQHLFAPPRIAVQPAAKPHPEMSLLNEAGRLWTDVNIGERNRWQDAIHRAGSLKHASAATRERVAWRHVWLGEYALAKNEDPQTALFHFRTAQHLTPRDSHAAGTAAYDTAILHYLQGRYREAAQEFTALITPSNHWKGFPRRSAALWQRRAGGATGYHARHGAMGIPEPPSLDPECGIAGLTVCLQARGLPHEKERILNACRITGLGNNFQDLLAACPRLGAVGRVVKADAKQLQRLPMPVIAHVEHDHFIVLTGADSKGVSYMCSDCGPWPGGSVRLTWKQWEQMEAGLFLTVVKPGSPEDRKLVATLSDFSDRPRSFVGVQVASASPQVVGQILQSTRAADAIAYRVSYALLQSGCGNRPVSPAGEGCRPMAADPVDMAAMEELQTPPPDLVVYNPNGPAVVWQRSYRSLRSNGGNDDNTNDFGACWTRSYNLMVYDPNVTVLPLFIRGTSYDLYTQDIFTSPATGLTWDLVQNGTTIATSTTPNGWSINTMANGYVNITVPTGATPGNNYELRWVYNYGNNSAKFNILGAYSVPQGQTASFIKTGTTAPAGTATWDILKGTTVVATSANPGEWKVTYPATDTLKVTAPINAALATNYTVRYLLSATSSLSAGFAVVGSGIAPVTGTKYLVLPDYNRIAFSAPVIPTATNPVVSCYFIDSGRPMIMQWCYDATSVLGYYRLTFGDGSQWTLVPQTPQTTPSLGYTSTFNLALVKKITNRTGQSILFNYSFLQSGASPWIPLLTTIVNASNNQVLLTINHNGGNGRVDSVVDVYNRAIYYTYADTVTAVGTVSQIVSKGTANPPMRWQYTYGLVAPVDSASYMLTASAPSPTGTGLSTSTIGYTQSGLVNSVTDANGNRLEFNHTAPQSYQFWDTMYESHTEWLDGNTVATTKDAAGNIVSSSGVLFGPLLNQKASFIGDNASTGVYVSSVNYQDPNCSFQPSDVFGADGYYTSYSYDGFGNVTQSRNTRGILSHYYYNYVPGTTGRLTAAQFDTRPQTTFEYYEPSGLVKTVTAPSPTGTGTVSVSFTYDTLGNILTVTRPGNSTVAQIVTTFNYTTDGTYTKTAAVGEPVTITDNLGHVRHFRYDSRGNVTSTWDALGNQVDYTYNLADQPLTVKYPATGQTGTGRSYDLMTYRYVGGPLIQQRRYNEANAQVKSTVYTYGLENELLGVSGNTYSVTRTYDALYRLKTLKDGNNNATTYTYNALGFVSQVTLPGGDAVSFPSYTNSGRLLQKVDGRGVVTNYQYSDPAGALTDIQYPASPSRNVHYTYDTYGRTTGRTDGTGSQAYTYDDLDQLTQVSTTYTGLSAKSIGYTYNADGSRASMSTPAGSFTYTYDGIGRLVQMVNPVNDATNWTYLDNNWLSTQTLANGVTTTYTNNALGQVTRLLNTLSSNTLSDFSGMTYDALGNRLGMTASLPAATNLSGSVTYQYSTRFELSKETSTQAGGWTGNYTYSPSGNPTSFKGQTRTYNSNNQLTGGTGLGTFAYDGNGNPTTYNSVTCTFDEQNHLTSVGSALSADYTASGVRAYKQDSTGNRTYFLYDGLTPVCELDNNGNLKAVNTFGGAGLVSRWTPTTPGGTVGTSVYYTFDARGNTAQRTDALGNVLSSHIYDAYGLVQSTGASTASEPFLFGAQAGYYTDNETGLILATFRYYDPANGRWLTRDPIGYAGGINLYAYCGNEPINGMDPLGLCDPGQAGVPQPPTRQSDDDDPSANVLPNGQEGNARYMERGYQCNRYEWGRQTSKELPWAVGTSIVGGVAAGVAPIGEGIIAGGIEAEGGAATASGVAAGRLRMVESGVWESPAGLRFGPGSAQGHRLAHVMEHLAPNLARPIHSVFDTQGHLIRTLDEAWVARGVGELGRNGNRVFVVDMGRVVGTSGETNITIVVREGTSDIITAFPSP